MKSVRIDLTTEAYEMAVELAEKSRSTVPTVVARAANRILELMANLERPYVESQDKWTNAENDSWTPIVSIDGKTMRMYNTETGQMRAPTQDELDAWENETVTVNDVYGNATDVPVRSPSHRKGS